MQTIYLIDASGFLYRSYFAIRNITNAKGESTNALFGFIRSLLKLRKDFNPSHLAAVFDGPHNAKKREMLYTDYKAHRKETPPDLIYQISWAQQVCELMGVPFLSVPEVEADDTMGSIALWAEKKGAKVYLCTSDKDLYQLVNDHIHILNTHKENLILGPSEVEEAFGVPPKQMIDLLAMVGDTSDNVPGLPGFGPKTAAALLKEFGSLDYILNNPQIVSGKKKETIEQFRDQALLSRQLVTIHTDVEFPRQDNFFAIKSIDTTPLKEFYASMNFNSLIRELEQTTPVSAKPPSEIEEHTAYTLVDTEDELTNLIHLLSQQKEVCFTTKTSTDTQPVKSELVGIGFSIQPKQAWYVPVNGRLGCKHVISQLKGLFENSKIQFYGHNVKFDYQVLANHGIILKSISFDTMLASYLLNSHSRQHSLEHLMLEMLGKIKMPFEVLVGKGKHAQPLANIPPMSVTTYCGEEVDYICRLKEILEAKLVERKLTHLMTDIEIPLLYVLANMERHGIYLDIPYITTISKDIQQVIAGLEQEIYSLAGEKFNINSPKQLSDILFVKMGIHPPKKTATGLSTNADVLESLSHRYPLAGKIIEYRTLEKLRSTYVDTLPLEVYPKTHRIHCTFNQSVAATGRLSCQDPNLQNIPIRSEEGRKIRAAFKPEKPDWSLLAADYSQIELRLLAHFSGDPTLIDAFNQGADIHTHTAANIFNVPLAEVTKQQRYSAKAVNFGIIYGQQAFGLAQEIDVDVKEAAIFIDAYFRRYPRVKEYLESCKEMARRTGKSVTYTGRERLIPEINSRNGHLRMLAERLAVNTPLQGTAADLIKLAMLQIDQKMDQMHYKGYMLLQIHDELIFEIPNTEIEQMTSLVREIMQGVLSLKVPLVVDIIVGKNWAEC